MRRSTKLVSTAVLALGTVAALPVHAAFAGVSGSGNSADPASRVKHLVVIYEENHSFDNLYGGWGSVGGRAVDGIGSPAYAASAPQVDQAGKPIGCLLQLDANLVPTTASVKWLDGSTHPGLQSVACSGTTPKNVAFDSHFSSAAPFAITDYVNPADKTCAPENLSPANGVEKGDPQGLPGGCTRDIVHRFYQEQYQIDGGKQDRYATGSDAAGLTMGYYDTQALPIWTYLHGPQAPKYVIADHFFQGAFGGSFLNHQYLVAARAPQWDTSQKEIPAGKNSALDDAGFPNSGYPLYAPQSGRSYVDGPLTEVCPTTGTTTGANGLPVDSKGRACGSYGVNTMQPPWQPSAGGSNVLPGINDLDPTKPDYETNIGDELSAKDVSWNWYSGGWDNAAGITNGLGWTNGTNGTSCTDPNHSASSAYPYCPDSLFQFHHQPLNYFQNYAPGMPGRSHLQDEADFEAAVDAGTLPAVSFVKPVGAENEHPGYASTDNGEQHLVDLLKRIEAGPDAASTLVVVTYDEFGGQWDHVAPPGQGNTDGPSDAYGPGTRIPAIIVGAPVVQSTVDHTSYDTTSILAAIERHWGVAPLGTRDAAVNDLLDSLKAKDRGATTENGPQHHVLLLSIDGMHQNDLDWYVAHHPSSTLANLTRTGTEYSNALASNPSDSDPGGTALMTGGNPRSTGVYYDVEYNHKTDEPGAACTPGRPPTGGDVVYDSPDDALANVNDLIDPANGTFPSFDENGSIYPQGADRNPAAIMNLRNDASSFNTATFPVDPSTCQSITPWDYLGDNTIFQVIHDAGLRTAWSDKHAVYMSFNGPGSKGKSIDDFFGPEIDSQAVMPNGVPYPQDDDWAHIDAATKQYDGYKVQAVVNEIDGLDHAGTTTVGTPAIFGMNFQTVSVAQKLRSTPTTLIGPDANGSYTTSAPEPGGYQWVDGQLVPGPALSSALDYVDAQLGRMVSEIHKVGLTPSTTIIVTAKHGQSPQDPTKLVTVRDGPIVGAINAAWAQTHPSNPNLIVAGTDDDLWQSYLSDTSPAACDFVKSYLWDHTAPGYDVNKNPVTVQHSGLAQIWAGADAARFFGVAVDDGRYPDVFGEVQEGVVYAKPTKLAEHGGMNTGDRHVLMLVNGPKIPAQVEASSVETTQVAPTILALLGLDPASLSAVRTEGTPVLPGL